MTKPKAGGEQPVEIPDTLPILPLRNSVLFPGAIIPIDVGRRKSVRLVEDAIAKERPVIGILTQKDARTVASVAMSDTVDKCVKNAKQEHLGCWLDARTMEQFQACPVP